MCCKHILGIIGRSRFFILNLKMETIFFSSKFFKVEVIFSKCAWAVSNLSFMVMWILCKTLKWICWIFVLHKMEKTIIYIDCPLMSNYSLFRSDAHLFEERTLFLIKDAELKTMDISFVLWSFFQLYINRVKLHFQVVLTFKINTQNRDLC